MNSENNGPGTNITPSVQVPPVPTQTQPLSSPHVQSMSLPPTQDLTALKTNITKKLLIGFGILLLVASATFGVFKILKKPSTSKASQSNAKTVLTQPGSSTVDTSSISTAYDGFANKGVREFTANKKASIIKKFQDLSAGFAIDSAFYKDQSSVLVGLGIAEQATDDSSHDDGYRNELYLALEKYLTSLPSNINDSYFLTPAQATNSVSVLNKYTDKSLTDKLSKAILDGGVRDEVAKSLKLSGASKLADYAVIALDFESASNRQKDFAKEYATYGATPQMWVSEVDGKQYLVANKEYAQSFVNNPQGDARNIILHELVHTQQYFGQGDLGHAIEERRAEYYSGDKSAYYDAKQLFIYTEVFSGKSVLNTIDAGPVDPDSFYLNLYVTFGTQLANQLTCAYPEAFFGSPSDAMVKAVAACGGMDGAIKTAIAIGKSDQNAMNSRMHDRYQKLIGILKTKQAVLDDLENNLNQNYNMPSATQTMKLYIATQ